MLQRTAVALALSLSVVRSGVAQGVVIQGATPQAVVEALKAELIPQGFQLVHADEKTALFALDRGMVSQDATALRASLVHIVLEFTARFKKKDKGLQVTASEEVVGNPRSSEQFRKPVQSLAERDNMQALLNMIRTNLESRGAAKDSTPR